ncbi:proteasome regulatory particle lid subunit RPN3 [Ascoidea rubescens DSM 1968]|uniref:PCI-domain-containing protein n=1 Tax=Ascoidea rubescens DSM 1968 TaxID=1344418 RepID=A0A1D2VRF3_9ASCO|nr:PCI-domain-containing protein [Ascoidea rubescens DSM 1968]ODV64147.1 PCI-domain-containing protein [Ascoidea rubescens DSM 1968]
MADVDMKEVSVASPTIDSIDTKDSESFTDKENNDEYNFNEILKTLKLLQKASIEFDSRYILKIFRDLNPLRKKLNSTNLNKLLDLIYNSTDKPNFQKVYLLEYLGQLPVIADEKSDIIYDVEMDVVTKTTDKEDENTTQNITTANDISEKPKDQFKLIPEIDLYIHFLFQLFLHDNNHLEILNNLNSKIIQLMNSYNKRTLDYIQAKIWFYISRTCELLDINHNNNNQVNESFDNLINLRSPLLLALKSSSLKHDTETHASIITLLLRNYLITNDIQQSINFIEKIQFPTNAGNNLISRYYYYLARIHTIQLNYSTALNEIITSIRKAPQSTKVLGFLISAKKLNVLIELLMGDIPDLKIFKKQKFSKSLKPYMDITKSVKLGDLKFFNETLETYSSVYKKDNNYNLILRLRKNVIKTGLRIISLSYKKISLKDICLKLQLDSESNAEYIISKLIKDNVLEATINHEKGFMSSKEILNVYNTDIPQVEFNNRIKFINDFHDEFVKSMRYPENKNRLNDSALNQMKDEELELVELLQDSNESDFF